jgi:hypothetical protein
MLRKNPAPLSGALFVKNPRRRRKMKMNRKARRSLKFRTLGGLFTAKHNRRRRSRKAKSGLLDRLIAKFRKNRVSVKMNRRRRVKMNRSHMKMNRRRRNAGYLLNSSYMLNRRRRRSRKNPMKSFMARGRKVSFFSKKNRRRNPSEGGGFALPSVLQPVKTLVGKVPFVGHPVAKALGYIAFGAAAGATHYYGMKAVRYVGGMLPAGVQSFGRTFVAPVGYSLLGVAANMALQKLPVPLLTDDQKRKLGVAAMIAGGVLDVYRFIKGQSSDLGDADDYGDGGAYDVVPLAGIGQGFGAIGEGFGAIGEGMGAIGEGMGGVYSDAEAADAAFSGPDLDSYEGEAALRGAPAYVGRFGPPPKIAARRVAAQSRHAGRPGHRWGWLIKLVGWERFGQIAAMEPEARVALIQELRRQALATVEASVGQREMAGIAEGMAGIGQGFGGIGQGFGMVASEGMGDLGFMSAGSAY